MAQNWTCPCCSRHTTLQSSDFQASTSDVVVRTASEDEAIRFEYVVIKCPNLKCGQFSVTVAAHHHKWYTSASGYSVIKDDSKSLKPVGPGRFRFAPRVGTPLSSHVPDAVRSDYEEASLISDISPKAAATLCRRALQGMIRDHWKVSKGTLAAELSAIEDRCDAALYGALKGLKSIGNIGAHPERDVNMIVDVEPGEVQELIELIRLLDQEWYVASAARAERLAKITAFAAAKTASPLKLSGLPPVSRTHPMT